ncbi:MAG: C40 family peptidase [Flavobacteriales bacterium]|jgi:cell wall-associated NlpC family hydrolase|nr:C40 family peptidase [Flavobacteriales bacterium]
MKKIYYILLLCAFLASCSTYKDKKTIPYTENKIEKAKESVVINRKPAVVKTAKPREVVTYGKTEATEKPADLKVLNIIDIAKSFNGTRYKFGGTTSAGMDCSGLVYTVFKEEDIQLPRSSRDMATKGNKINFREISKGDLVFFKTNRSKIINHVGLVVDVLPGKVLFIHSSTSQGVIISSLDERYWNESFVEARRII